MLGLRFNLDGFADYARPADTIAAAVYTPPPPYALPAAAAQQGLAGARPVNGDVVNFMVNRALTSCGMVNER